MSSEDIVLLDEQLRFDSMSIKGQLDQATATFHETGERSNSDWFRRATAAGAIIGWKIQRLQREMGRIRRETKLKRGAEDALRDQGYERAFFLLAKEKFPDTFKQIVEQLGEMPCPTCEGQGGHNTLLGHGDFDSETCSDCRGSGMIAR